MAVAVSVALRMAPLYLPVAHEQASRVVRARAAADFVRSDPNAATLAPPQFERALAEWRSHHADSLALIERETEQQLRDALTFEGEDGARHVYLGGEDGYYWLKLTQTMLSRGTVCDRADRGTCIDALGNAPLGQPIEYTGSPHVYLMAALQWILTRVRPGFPLSTTAILIPMLLSALVAIPAFLIAERVAGRLGGLTAALLLACNALVFVRGNFSDDDIWIVVLPVLSMGSITAAFGRSTWRGRILLSGLGGVLLAVLAAAWKGWPLFALYTLAGLIALAAWASVAALVAKLRGRPRGVALVRVVGGCALSIVAGFAAAAGLLGVHIDLGVITGGLSDVIGLARPAPPTVNTAPLYDVFRTVEELISVNAETLQHATGPLAAGLGLVGFGLALRAPSGRRQGLLVLSLLVIGPVIAALLGHYGSRRIPLLMLPALAGLAGATAAWFLDPPPSDRAAATGILGLAWLGATLWMSFEGERYILLSMAPLSVAAGIALGRIGPSISAVGLRRIPRPRAVAGALAALTLAPVAIQGWTQAMAFAPRVNKAWTDGFAAIRAQSNSDAIVDLWWDYGHWAKYYTDRAVVLDGASLLNRSVQWMARALAAPSDTEALGWLRLLNCGAVKDPDGGVAARPYETLIRWSADHGLAFRSMLELSRLPRDQAAAYLRGAGLPEARLSALLETAYCTPRQSFLVLTTDLLKTRSWLVFGLWDPGRAFLVDLARRSSVQAALPTIEEKYGMPEAVARDYYAAASRIRTEEERVDFAAPGAQTWSSGWQACTRQDQALHCRLDLGELSSVTVDPDHPEQTRVRITPRNDAPVDATPALVEIAGPDSLREVPIANPSAALAVLVDPGKARVFVGTPSVVRSTLVRLALLDGRYSAPFRKIYDQVAVDGQRITVWRIEWVQP